MNFRFIFLLLLITKLNAQNVWIKHPTPVLSRSAVFPSWKALATADPFVMLDNDTLKMWYSATGWTSASDNCPHVRMGYAWSLNGTNWTEYAGNPVLDISADTSKFDSDGIETPCVIKDTLAPAAQRYKLWYAGRKKQCSAVLDHKIGYAYSPDGKTWTKYAANPILAAAPNSYWYNTFISNPSVLKEGTIYKMWFTAPDLITNSQPTDGKGNIAYATSTDGISWAVHSSPVIVAGDQNNWDTVVSSEPHVLKIGNQYHMFYSALNTFSVEHFQMGYAASSDGINWIKSIQNPVLKIGGPGKWDRYWASHACAIYDQANNKFKMWYTGRDTATISSVTGHYWDIGYAESIFISSGLNALSSHKTISIFPNPASSLIHLNSNVPLTKIELKDLLGNNILKQTNINGIKEISIAEFEPGIYFLIGEDANGRSFSEKILITR